MQKKRAASSRLRRPDGWRPTGGLVGLRRSLAALRLIESYGGKAQAIAFVEGYSTTELVRRIRAHAAP